MMFHAGLRSKRRVLRKAKDRTAGACEALASLMALSLFANPGEQPGFSL